MIAQFVTFNLKDFADADYRRACEEDLAGPIGGQAGLISKTWIADPDSNTYGGFYVWRARADAEAFARSEVFVAFSSDPRIQNIESTVFEVLEAPSRATHGVSAAAV